MCDLRTTRFDPMAAEEELGAIQEHANKMATAFFRIWLTKAATRKLADPEDRNTSCIICHSSFKKNEKGGYDIGSCGCLIESDPKKFVLTDDFFYGNPIPSHLVNFYHAHVSRRNQEGW